MTHDVDLSAAAALIHRKYDWMQKNWRRLVADEGFPRPFIGGRPGGRPWWRAAAIEAWKDRQGQAQTDVNLAQPDPAATPGPSTANDPAPRRPAPASLASRLVAAAGGAR